MRYRVLQVVTFFSIVWFTYVVQRMVGVSLSNYLLTIPVTIVNNRVCIPLFHTPRPNVCKYEPTSLSCTTPGPRPEVSHLRRRKDHLNPISPTDLTIILTC